MNFDFTDIKEKYIDNVKLELEERWNKWNINFETRYINEVIMGILSRQSSLAIQIFSNPSIWNPEIAPIILRSMIENHLNLAWIFLNKEENCQKFIEHGYGQMKLNLEHFKSKNTIESEEIQKYIELEEELEAIPEPKLDDERKDFLKWVEKDGEIQNTDYFRYDSLFMKKTILNSDLACLKRCE